MISLVLLLTSGFSVSAAWLIAVVCGPIGAWGVRQALAATGIVTLWLHALLVIAAAGLAVSDTGEGEAQ